MLDSCLFAVHATDSALLTEVRSRIARLAAWYEALAPVATSIRDVDGLPLIAGAIRLGPAGPLPRAEGILGWGGPLPDDLSEAEDLIFAGTRALRRIDGTLAAVAVTAGRARIVTGAGPPTSLYAADAPGIRAWSSHAVAASYLARGFAALDRAAIPELLATEHLGGDRTLIAGCRAVAAATCIDFDARTVGERTYWSGGDRWRLVPEDEAYAVAERALLDGLARRLPHGSRAWLGLTGGIDSRVAAVALRLIGRDFVSFTWGGGPDLDGARRVAADLGVRHEPLGRDLWSDREAGSRISAAVRWHEGLTPLGLGRLAPLRQDAVQVTGGGGEAGRAFYWRQASRIWRCPTPRQARRWLRRLFEPALAGAHVDARAALREAIADRVRQAEAVGLSGWRLLDGVYVDQRMQRWARGWLPLQRPPVVHAFGAPAVAAALVSLPIEERSSDGFHRRFLELHRSELSLGPHSPPGRPGRLAAASSRARLAAASIRARRTLPVRGPSVNRGLWADRPRLSEWVADGVLGSEIVGEALGHGWSDAVRTAFLGGEAVAERLALGAAAAVALGAALDELNRSRPSRGTERATAGDGR